MHKRETEPQLTDAHIERYSRQIILREIGGIGQRRLMDSTVTLIGADAVATTAMQYLTAAGIGRIDWFPTGRGAADRGRWHDALVGLNPSTRIHMHRLGVRKNALKHTASAPLLCTSTTAEDLARFNRVALQHRAPLLVGSASPRGGWVSIFTGHLPAQPCAECSPLPADPVTPPSVATVAIAGVIGSVLALEVVKSCVGFGSSLSGRALHYDAETSTMIESPIGKRESCRACAPACAPSV